MPFTNYGLTFAMQYFFRGVTWAPASPKLALATGDVAPTADTVDFSELTEIAAGNGYTAGGLSLTRNTTDFDAIDEDDTNDYVTVDLKDVTWTPSGGPIPSSGGGARYAVLLGNSGGGATKVIAYQDLGSDYTRADGVPLTLQDLKFRFSFVSGVTNRGLKRILDAFFRNQNVPTTLYALLATSATDPGGADINTVSDITEIAAGSGYTSGGIAVARSSLGFDAPVQDDANDRATIQAVNLVFAASGGTLPASGDGARYCALTDDNGTVADRDIICSWDLSSDRSVSDGNSIIVTDAEIRGQN